MSGRGKTRGNKATASADGGGPELTAAERELLLAIVRRHRTTIPTYLQSRQEEIRIVDDLIRKLSQEP